MRLVSYGRAGEERAGVLRGEEVIDLNSLRSTWPAQWRGVLEAGHANEIESLAADLPGARAAANLSAVRLGPPIPNPSKIVAIGLNYRDHAVEQGKEPPEVPLLFAKAPTCLIGNGEPIVLPAEEAQADAEAELCVVIGVRARQVARERAFDHVLGYTIMNDVSGRAAQYGDKQWFRGKSFDSFGPCGPWIVTRRELPDPSGLRLEADWNGSAIQRGNTNDLIHDVAALVAYVSAQMTLLPGDLISTGTPAGVGVYRKPPLFLEHGDRVVIRLEGVGELVNPVRRTGRDA